MLTTSDQMQKIFANFVNGMMVLAPPRRAEVMRWVAECYCTRCGYPAPPKGETCGCDDPGQGVGSCGCVFCDIGLQPDNEGWHKLDFGTGKMARKPSHVKCTKNLASEMG